ncbi:MAG: tRNA (uridine(34)/cytosine(34)/5-carboxymethylaminomethyluridine(34)-2'-O)-methyltransferase TrmL [Clostridia bacterium]|nr:tRNA (uridine(34)/cytosine(34)/5-carboxymethylaminomethyluridine(34)-2'-O)-methyltransferase TrmL [Clostridia bacterium]
MINHLNIVLHEPEIPQNTGNISRTCAATGASLHLIEPLGFEITDRHLKRAGLDYWQYLDIHYYKNIQDFFSKNTDSENSFWFFTTKGKKIYTEPEYKGNVFLFFGKETKGLPEELLYENYDKCVRIPMLDGLRSLNLSNSVAIAVYEVLRQQSFCDLLTEGKLTRYNV